MSLLPFIESHNPRVTTLGQDKAFLEKLGPRIRKIRKEEITPELIQNLSSQLDAIYDKLAAEGKLTDKIDTILIDLESDAMLLEQKIEDKNLDKEFFKTILSLGQKISKFARSMRFIISYIVVDNIDPPPFW